MWGHLDNSSASSHKRMSWPDNFIKNFQRYQQNNPGVKLDFLPQTYRLSTESGQEAFRKRLFERGGINYPWVLKNPDVNNGKGVEMLGPNSHELKTVLKRVESESEDIDYIIQEYVCNELTWWRNKKFDLRFYWAVASVDPLIVLYHDGYVRVGNSVYTETEFGGPRTQHLTTHTFLSDEEKGTIEELQERVRYHYQQNRRNLKKRIKIDPFEHVRNQFKEALAQMIAAFRDVTFGYGMKNSYKFENCKLSCNVLSKTFWLSFADLFNCSFFHSLGFERGRLCAGQRPGCLVYRGPGSSRT